jgi:NAD(P)-dependent dehydrogenase (short-subunit alcohol dehydrogenase family)
MNIEGNSAIVTGGASGMGQATAQRLIDQGVKVSILDSNEKGLAKVAKKMGALGILCNVFDGQSVEDALARASERNGVARICVNCAGIAPAQRIVGREGPHTLEEFARVVNVNLVGTFNVMRLAAAQMFASEPLGESGERGVIINTASVAAYEGQIGQAAYSASKGGVVAMTLPAAREFASMGVRVMAIAPGLIGTPMLLNMPEEVQRSLAQQVPFPKRFGDPDEFARLVIHIIQNEMLNGEVIRLDGAIRMQPK